MSRRQLRLWLGYAVLVVPDAETPVWPIEDLRDRFIRAFRTDSARSQAK